MPAEDASKHDDVDAARRIVKRLGHDKALSAAEERELSKLLDRAEAPDARGTAQDKAVKTRDALIEELQAKLQAYEEKFNEIKEPPLLAGYVLRLDGADLGETELAVAHGNQVLKVHTGNLEKALSLIHI